MINNVLESIRFCIDTIINETASDNYQKQFIVEAIIFLHTNCESIYLSVMDPILIKKILGEENLFVNQQTYIQREREREIERGGRERERERERGERNKRDSMPRKT